MPFANGDMHKLCEINPYDDVERFPNNLQQIIQICKYILDKKLLCGYDELNEGYQMRIHVESICHGNLM